MRIMSVGGINLWKHKHGSWLIRGWERRRPLKITCTQNAQWAQAWNRDFQYTKKLWTKYVFELKKREFTTPNVMYICIRQADTTGRVNYDHDAILHPILMETYKPHILR